MPTPSSPHAIHTGNATQNTREQSRTSKPGHPGTLPEPWPGQGHARRSARKTCSQNAVMCDMKVGRNYPARGGAAASAGWNTHHSACSCYVMAAIAQAFQPKVFHTCACTRVIHWHIASLGLISAITNPQNRLYQIQRNIPILGGAVEAGMCCWHY